MELEATREADLVRELKFAGWSKERSDNYAMLIANLSNADLPPRGPSPPEKRLGKQGPQNKRHLGDFVQDDGQGVIDFPALV